MIHHYVQISSKTKRMLQLQKQSNSEIFFIIVDGFAAVGEELEDVIGLFQFKDVPPIDANL